MARESAQHGERPARSHAARLRVRIGSALAQRVSPERTRRATLLERLTVRRLSWDMVVRCNRYPGLLGKIATGIWVGFLVSLVLGFDWKEVVRDALNSGRPLEGAFALVVLLPTLLFLATRSLIGFRALAASARVMAA